MVKIESVKIPREAENFLLKYTFIDLQCNPPSCCFPKNKTRRVVFGQVCSVKNCKNLMTQPWFPAAVINQCVHSNSLPLPFKSQQLPAYKLPVNIDPSKEKCFKQKIKVPQKFGHDSLFSQNFLPLLFVQKYMNTTRFWITFLLTYIGPLLVSVCKVCRREEEEGMRPVSEDV